MAGERTLGFWGRPGVVPTQTGTTKTYVEVPDLLWVRDVVVTEGRGPVKRVSGEETDRPGWSVEGSGRAVDGVTGTSTPDRPDAPGPSSI